MIGKTSAFIGTTSNAIADFLLDQAVNNYNMYQVMYIMSFCSLGFSLLSLPILGFSITLKSFLVSLFYAFAYFLGDYTYTKALKTLPISIIGLLESGNLFLILLCDTILGYVKPSWIFVFLFLLFVGSIWMFTMETEKMKGTITRKKIDMNGLIYLIISVVFYAATPYFIKLALSWGGSELSVSMVYYLLAIFGFYLLSKKNKEKKHASSINRRFWRLIFAMSFFFGLYTTLIMVAYQTESPIVIAVIEEVRVFLLVIFAVITKTDKMNFKKTVSLLVGMSCVIGLSILGG